MSDFIRQNKLFSFYTALVILLVLIAILAPYLAPQDPSDGNMRNVLQQPSVEHFLGTDKLGHDTFSRIICGTQIPLFMTICVVILLAKLIVMSQDKVVEAGATQHVIKNPQHDYTKSLLASVPEMGRRRYV